jgi:hypothetical protein
MMKVSQEEREAVRLVLEAGASHGYGNLISHLRTAWAAMLMAEYGFSLEEAQRGAGGAGYPLRMQQDVLLRGEWDETGERYRGEVSA